MTLVCVTCAAVGCGSVDRAPLGAPVPVGPGPAYRPPPLGADAAAGRPIAGLRCKRRVGARAVAHLELFARGLVVAIPPGIGVAPPAVRRGAYVLGGRCHYPLSTLEATGLIELQPGIRLTVGQLFAIWGQPLSRTRLARFRASPGGHVAAFVGGLRRGGDPASIPLAPHAVITLEVGEPVTPHPIYRFPPGR